MFRHDRSLSLTHTTSQLFQLTVLLASAIASAPKKKLWVCCTNQSYSYKQGLGSLWDSGHRLIDIEASKSADEFRMANKTIIIDAFEMLSNNERNGGGSRKDLHMYVLRT